MDNNTNSQTKKQSINLNTRNYNMLMVVLAHIRTNACPLVKTYKLSMECNHWYHKCASSM